MNEETNTQINMAKMQKDIEYIKQGLSVNDKQHKEILKKMDDWIEHAEQHFAAKWTELVLKATIGIMGSAFLLYLFDILIRHKL